MDKKLWSEVEKIQKDFEYIQGHSDGSKYPQHWICRNKDQSSIYRFEIIIGNYSISINGDIGSLSWGIHRNLAFLAGDDIDYYIYSKLDTVYKDLRELDPESLERFIVNEMALYVEKISSELHENGIFKKMAEKELGYTEKEVLDDEDKMYELDEKIYELNNEYTSLSEKTDTNNPISLEEMIDIYIELDINNHNHVGWNVYEELHDVDDINDLYNRVVNIDGLEFDYSDNNFTMPSESVIFKLYMVCYAARKIQEQLNCKKSTEVDMSLA